MASKRGNEEGSIYQRQDGLWVASISLGFDGKGTRVRKTLYGKTRKEVAAKLLELQKAKAEGLPVARRDITLETLLTEYLATVQPRLRPKTYASYALLSRSYVVPTLGKTRLADLDARKIESWMRSLLAESLSPHTVGLSRALLRRAVEQAVRWDWVPRNVVDLTSPPRVERRVPPAQSVEQAQAILTAFEGTRFGPLITVVLGLGLRIGEALGLRWEDIEYEAERPVRLSVRVQLQYVNGQFSLTPPKSARAVRCLHLPSFVADALIQQKRTQDELIPKWEELGCANSLRLVFTNWEGGPLEYQNVRRQCVLTLRRAGIEGVRLHDLRHLCASLLLARNIHPRVVMEILGHSQISLTMNTYSHVLPGIAAGAATAMDELMRPGK